MADREDLLSLNVPCDLHAPVLIRDQLVGVHDGTWSLDDGLLIASELVGNAVRHSGCEDDHNLDVQVRRDQTSLLISVHDPGLTGKAALPVSAPPSEPGGWGLRIIERLSRRWGAESPDGCRVWAELPVQA